MCVFCREVSKLAKEIVEKELEDSHTKASDHEKKEMIHLLLEKLARIFIEALCYE